MSNLIKNVFFTLMAVIIAVILYFIFFGTTTRVDSTTYEIQDNWKGALFYAAENVETSISRYYYMYCFLPTVQLNDRTDELLGYNSIKPIGTNLVINSTSNYSNTEGYPYFRSCISCGDGILENYH